MTGLKKTNTGLRYIRYDKAACIGGSSCLKVCPTLAIRMKNGKAVRNEDHCIGCGECIRVCQEAAVTAATGTLNRLDKDKISVALVTPVLYAQFPGVMPEDILMGLKSLGFQHTVDMSYFLEMFQYATEEFIVRNKTNRQSPWPLISPVCPVVIRLIAFKFPSLMPHVLPLSRPVDLMARDVRQRIMQEYAVSEDKVMLYYINPCPTKRGPLRSASPKTKADTCIAIGINDIYADLLHQIEPMQDTDQVPNAKIGFDFEYCHTGNGPMWGMSGGEIADMNIENSLAVSGLDETITYLEKIEIGLFSNLEYIELRTCREGCLGGALTAIDKYLAKSAVNKMIKMLGLGRRLSRKKILRQFEKGKFLADKDPARLIQMFGSHAKPMSIETVQKVDEILERINGHDCAVCGAPTCKTFAEDVVKGEASLNECVLLGGDRAC
ncbi:MAG: 4Fe-4S binding protein [Deltaproteobacteria bacterium]|nr:4Fe-4S binding protein [Deltaproteobacteria bacterium]